MKPTTPAGTLCRSLAALTLSLACLGALAGPPAAPVMSITTSGQKVTIAWNAVASASGYVLYYAPYPNVDYIGHVDAGTVTALTADLPLGAAYYAAIRARNADGESGYSNIDHVVIPTGGTVVLQAGDYWEFEWTDSSTSSSSSGTSTTEKSGVFRVTLGAPQSLGGRAAFPITVSGDPSASFGKPIWNYLAADGPVLLGTRDGTLYSTVLGSESGGWKGSGFFSFFRTDLAKVSSRGTFQGNYRTTGAWVVTRSASSGGCTYYPEVGGNVCAGDPSNYSESEYQKAGIGPIGYRYSSSASYSGGGFYSTVTIVRTIELLKSSRVADDGAVFTGSPWAPLADIARPSYIRGAAALNGSVLAFGGYWVSGGPPWVQVYDPRAGTWGAALSSGAETSIFIGANGGSLYAVGKTSSSAATSLLRFDAAANRWQPIAGSTPAFSNPCGAAVLASGDLAVLDCPGTAAMNMRVYSLATALWRAGVSYGSTILRPAVAAIGNDVYVMGGYSSGSRSITSTVRRFRSQTNAWENMTVTMRTPRDDARAVAIGSKLYVMGGSPASSSAPDGRVVEVLDTASGTWGAGPTMPQNRSSFVAAVLDGRVYIIGGLDSANVWLKSGVVLIP